MDKEVRAFIRTFADQPDVEVVEGGKHVLVYKSGSQVCVLPKTPSDHRWRANTAAQLRRAGITPSVNRKPDALLHYRQLMPLDELRTRIAAIKPLAEFARFVQEDMVTLSAGWTAPYKTLDSAEVSLATFIHGGGLRNSSHERLDHALRTWDRIRSQEHKAGLGRDFRGGADVTIATPEPAVAFIDVSGAVTSQLTVELDVAKLNRMLAAFGVTVKVTGEC